VGLVLQWQIGVCVNIYRCVRGLCMCVCECEFIIRTVKVNDLICLLFAAAQVPLKSPWWEKPHRRIVFPWDHDQPLDTKGAFLGLGA